MRWPKIQPMPPTVWQCDGIPRWQYSQRPHLVMAGTSTRSPTANALHRVADRGDRADRFVAEDPAVGHRGHVALQDVQVGAADRGRVDADDHVGRLLDRGVRDVLPGLRARTVVDQRLHRRPPSRRRPAESRTTGDDAQRR